jgi:hypothetical protein
MKLLISASRAAGITGMSHRCPASACLISVLDNAHQLHPGSAVSLSPRRHSDLESRCPAGCVSCMGPTLSPCSVPYFLSPAYLPTYCSGPLFFLLVTQPSVITFFKSEIWVSASFLPLAHPLEYQIHPFDLSLVSWISPLLCLRATIQVAPILAQTMAAVSDWSLCFELPLLPFSNPSPR